jgi:hypothetical protein
MQQVDLKQSEKGPIKANEIEDGESLDYELFVGEAPVVNHFDDDPMEESLVA